MSAFSNYLENALLNHVLRGVALTAPTTVYAALFTNATVMSDAALGTEVTGGGYTRKPVSFNAAANGQCTNQEVIFDAATADWGTIRYVGIFDAASGTTNLLFWGQLSADKLISTGDQFKFAANNLTVTLD